MEGQTLFGGGIVGRAAGQDTNMWGIYGVHVRKWLNATQGWGEVGNATRYNYADKSNTPLPFGGVWKQIQPAEKSCAGFVPDRLPANGGGFWNGH